MKIVSFLAATIFTTVLIFILNTKMVLPAPLGALLSPQHGLWQNAEPTNINYSDDVKIPGLKGKSTVYFDERLIPHVFAEQEFDAYMIQGYLHAKFRLFQMELQTNVAAGRAAEMVGDVAVKHDREFRRLGMVFAAEKAQIEMEKDPETKATCDAYTQGVNAYINSLTESSLPVEYKLLGCKPELWSNLKTALFLKLMSNDLAGHDADFEMTNAKHFFSAADFELLYPSIQDSLDPIIPKGTLLPKPSITPIAPKNVDSAYFSTDIVMAEEFQKPDPENGSNNWAVSGKKTASGAPILCNDPHLGLNLPSIWYEMQLSTPSFNAYGATFPGAPSVIIGFNDSCAFGFTNGGRDVRDYYEIKFKDKSRSEYWFNNAWQKTTFRYETIKVAGKPNVLDTVAYTVFGPVMYDKSFNGGRLTNNKNYAVRWKAHDAGNELKIFNLLNKAKNYADYSKAAPYLHTPGQNCIFACKDGDIAIRTQGEWPAKWKGQGDFVMPGIDSSYMWQGMIPQNEVPFQYNPERGFVSSANQKPVDDKTYPYYMGRQYPVARGLIVNKKLAAMQNITPQDMMAMQTNNFNVYAQEMMPLLLKNLSSVSLDAAETKYLNLLSSWNFEYNVNAKAATVYEVFYNIFKENVYKDEYTKAPTPIQLPFESSLIEATLKDSTYKFFDDISTATVKESRKDMLVKSFKEASKKLTDIEKDGKLEWATYKGTHIDHLLKQAAFSRKNLPIGGGTSIINATRDTHGPSWRMVVSLTEKTEAYGVYPGGQNGNPGSKYYDQFVDQWVAGKYYPLWMMTKAEAKDARVKFTMNFSN
jgi:penicillin G amidase